MPAKNTKREPDPDWELVARDYVSGLLTIKAICDKFTSKKKKITLNPSRLHYQMKKRGFFEQRKKVAATLRNSPIPDSQSTDVIVKQAADVVQEIARRQTVDLERTQKIVSAMLQNVQGCIKEALELPKNPSDEELRNVSKPLFIGGRETLADYVKKLGETQIKGIAMERKCLGLDKDDDDGGLAPYEERLKQLYDLEQKTLSGQSGAIEGEFERI